MALRAPNTIALCAGVGGLDLGLRLALPLSRTVCYVEREAAAAASLVASMEAGWFHPAPVWSDMRTFDARRWRGVVDCVTSGDPCQGNSVAGKRLGQLDDRWLLDRAIDIFDASGAACFFRENVPGNADGQLAVAIPALERLGCRVAVGIFSSAETGNTMRRERLFILAYRELAQPDGGRRRDGELQRGGQFGFQPQGGGTGGNAAELGGATSPRPLSGAQPGTDCGDEGAGSRDAQPERRGSELAQPIGPVEARRFAASGEAAGGRTYGQSGGSGGALERSAGPLDRPQGIGPGAFGAEHEIQQWRDAIAQPGCAMGGTVRPELQGEQRGEQRGEHHPAGRKVKDGPAALSGGAGFRPALPPAVIPGPTDRRWIDVLDRFPELQPALSQEEAESHLRRGIDALADRIERLRATGNGVDPVTAAYAFLHLRKRLGI